MEMPSQEEQMIAEHYVLERPMVRPDTDCKKAIRYVSIYFVVSFFIALLSYHLFAWLGIFNLTPEFIQELNKNYPIAFEFLFFGLIFTIVGLLCLKKALIGAIRLYQHYAPEDIRRRCLFKPTCSEYAILAIKKYGVIIGLFKAYIRLFKKCRGNIYRIDYP